MTRARRGIRPRGAGVLMLAVVMGSVLGCATGGSGPAEVGNLAVLFAGDQARIDRLAEAVRSGRIVPDPDWIRDTRRLPGDVLLRTRYGNGVAQLRVETVSDFFTCLLQFRENVSTREILERVRPDLLAICDPDTCDVCISWTYSLDPRVREAVIDYWVAWLKQRVREGGGRHRLGYHG